jgi:hypothetical protein
MWESVCTKLRFRLFVKPAEAMVFIQNYLDGTLPSIGGDWKVFLRTLEKVAVENEQRDVEGGVLGLLMKPWSGTPAHLSFPLFPTSALHA